MERCHLLDCVQLGHLKTDHFDKTLQEIHKNRVLLRQNLGFHIWFSHMDEDQIDSWRYDLNDHYILCLDWSTRNRFSLAQAKGPVAVRMEWETSSANVRSSNNLPFLSYRATRNRSIFMSYFSDSFCSRSGPSTGKIESELRCMCSIWKFQHLLVLMIESSNKIIGSISCVLRNIHTNQQSKIAFLLQKSSRWNLIDHIYIFSAWHCIKNGRCYEVPFFFKMSFNMRKKEYKG